MSVASARWQTLTIISTYLTLEAMLILHCLWLLSTLVVWLPSSPLPLKLQTVLGPNYFESS